MIVVYAPHFVAAVECGSRVIRTAPILKYMRGWTPEHVLAYCESKGWEAVEIS